MDCDMLKRQSVRFTVSKCAYAYPYLNLYHKDVKLVVGAVAVVAVVAQLPKLPRLKKALKPTSKDHLYKSAS